MPATSSGLSKQNVRGWNDMRGRWKMHLNEQKPKTATYHCGRMEWTRALSYLTNRFVNETSTPNRQRYIRQWNVFCFDVPLLSRGTGMLSLSRSLSSTRSLSSSLFLSLFLKHPFFISVSQMIHLPLLLLGTDCDCWPVALRINHGKYLFWDHQLGKWIHEWYRPSEPVLWGGHSGRSYYVLDVYEVRKSMPFCIYYNVHWFCTS